MYLKINAVDSTNFIFFASENKFVYTIHTETEI
jgi:hypothetical protein